VGLKDQPTAEEILTQENMKTNRNKYRQEKATMANQVARCDQLAAGQLHRVHEQSEM
jgi:hypothetical protein